MAVAGDIRRPIDQNRLSKADAIRAQWSSFSAILEGFKVVDFFLLLLRLNRGKPKKKKVFLLFFFFFFIK